MEDATPIRILIAKPGLDGHDRGAKVMARAFRDAGFEVIEAASGGEALELLQAGITLDALLTDIRLPGADGWAVAKAYRERFPDLPVLYVTGYVEQMQPVPGGIIVSKPYRMAQVIGVLETCVA